MFVQHNKITNKPNQFFDKICLAQFQIGLGKMIEYCPNQNQIQIFGD